MKTAKFYLVQRAKEHLDSFLQNDRKSTTDSAEDMLDLGELFDIAYRLQSRSAAQLQFEEFNRAMEETPEPTAELPNEIPF